MEHFFYEDTFCSDLEDLANVFDIDEDNVNELKDDWQVRVELSDLEPIFNVDADNLCQLLADANEDRLSEDFDEEAKVLKALKETIDFEKLKEENRAKEFVTIQNNRNTSNARESNTKIQESSNSSWLAKNTPFILDFVIVFAVFILGYSLLYVQIPEANIQIMNIMFGTLLGILGTVYNYHRGSSNGSAAKQDIINKISK